MVHPFNPHFCLARGVLFLVFSRPCGLVRHRQHMPLSTFSVSLQCSMLPFVVDGSVLPPTRYIRCFCLTSPTCLVGFFSTTSNLPGFSLHDSVSGDCRLWVHVLPRPPCLSLMTKAFYCVVFVAAVPCFSRRSTLLRSPFAKNLFFPFQ